MLAKEHIYNLKTAFEEAGSTIASKSDRHLMYMLDEARAILVSRKITNRHDVSNMLQNFTVPMLKATPDLLGTVGSKTVKYCETPKPISLHHGNGIFFVGSTDFLKGYTRTDFSRLRTMSHRKYTGKVPQWIFTDNKILVTNLPTTGISKVAVRGVFDEPYKVLELMGKIDPFNPLDFEYPLSMKDAQAVYDIAMSGDLSWGDVAAQTIRNMQAKQRRNAEDK